MGKAELKLWRKLRMNLLGWHFRKQVPVGPYVLDFYCATARLCVEVDGDFHVGRIDADMERDALLAGLGILTIRIPTPELHNNMLGVCQMIWETCESRAPKQ